MNIDDSDGGNIVLQQVGDGGKNIGVLSARSSSKRRDPNPAFTLLWNSAGNRDASPEFRLQGRSCSA